MVGLHLHPADGADGAQQRGQASLQEHRARRAGQHLRGEVGLGSSRAGVEPLLQTEGDVRKMSSSVCCRMYRQASNAMGINYPPNVITELKVTKNEFVKNFDKLMCVCVFSSTWTLGPSMCLR